MQIEDAKKQIAFLQNYIKMIEDYQADTFEQEVMLLYVQEESVTKVVDELNRRGHRIGKRKLNTVDISDLIRAKPQDEMHELARKIFKSNKKKSVGTGWN